MADIRGFDSTVQRIEAVLETMREALAPMAAMLSDAVRDRVIPHGDRLSAELASIHEDGVERQAVDREMALVVARQAAAIGIRKAEFDQREQPTRLERAIGLFSRKAVLTRQRARWQSPGPLTHLLELLRRADILVGIVRKERGALLLQRREREEDLSAYIARRAEVVEGLRNPAGQEGQAGKPVPKSPPANTPPASPPLAAKPLSSVEAVRRSEEFLNVVETFIGRLNERVTVYNVLLHKLLADTDDLLILYRVQFDTVRVHGSQDLKAEAFPHLGAELGRYVSGMLTVHGLDARRQRADEAFAEKFPAEAAGEAAAEARPVRGGRGLSALAGFRFARS